MGVTDRQHAPRMSAASRKGIAANVKPRGVHKAILGVHKGILGVHKAILGVHKAIPQK